jgi:hypothetical protein
MSKGRLFTLAVFLLAGFVAALPRLARSGNPFDIEVIVEDGHEFNKPLRDVEPPTKHRSDRHGGAENAAHGRPDDARPRF